MLAYIRKGIMSGKTAASYLGSPDINDNQWLTRNKGENAGFFCDVDLDLTEELKTYLLYFNMTADKNTGHTLRSFSNLPIKGV